MDRRGFLGIMGILAAGVWLGVRGLWKRADDTALKEAMHYRKLGD